MFKRKIRKGIALLDAERPDWRVNLRQLQLSSSCNCVLGQVYGNYRTGVSMLGITDGVLLGFSLCIGDVGDGGSWKTLTAEWIEAIKEHRRKRKKETRASNA